MQHNTSSIKKEFIIYCRIQNIFPWYWHLYMLASKHVFTCVLKSSTLFFFFFFLYEWSGFIWVKRRQVDRRVAEWVHVFRESWNLLFHVITFISMRTHRLYASNFYSSSFLIRTWPLRKSLKKWYYVLPHNNSQMKRNYYSSSFLILPYNSFLFVKCGL